MSSRLPPALREAITQDRRRVRPLGPPLRRTAAFVGVAFALPVAVLTIWGLRSDWAAVGGWRLWGLSAAQIGFGVGLAAHGLRESLPGHLASRRSHLLLGAIGAALVLGVTVLTFSASRTFVPAAFASRYFWICVTHPLVLGLPALGTVFFVAWCGLVSRPVMAGVLAGLSAGLVSDASWRLSCHVADPRHVLAAHLGAMLALTAAGAAAGALRRQWRPRDRDAFNGAGA